MTVQQLEHRNKAYSPLQFKAEGEDAGDGTKLLPGEFIALAAVFGNVDSYGDRMIKGAFSETLEVWAQAGDPIPVIWQHNWSDPNAHIGFVLEAKETDAGLWYKGKLDVEDNPFAAQVYRLMKARRVTQQSFGFDVLDGRAVTEEGSEVFEITRVHLYEVGPCLVGVNQGTNLLDIKSGSPVGKPAGEPSGQAPAAESTEASAPPASAPPVDSASNKGYSPASVLLTIDALNLEMED